MGNRPAPTLYNESKEHCGSSESILPGWLGDVMIDTGSILLPQQADCNSAGEALPAVWALRPFSVILIWKGKVEQTQSTNAPVQGAAKVGQDYGPKPAKDCESTQHEIHVRNWYSPDRV